MADVALHPIIHNNKFNMNDINNCHNNSQTNTNTHNIYIVISLMLFTFTNTNHGTNNKSTTW